MGIGVPYKIRGPVFGTGDTLWESQKISGNQNFSISLSGNLALFRLANLSASWDLSKACCASFAYFLDWMASMIAMMAQMTEIPEKIIDRFIHIFIVVCQRFLLLRIGLSPSTAAAMTKMAAMARKK